MVREKIKFDQYKVQGKKREFSVVVVPKQRYLWAYYEDFDNEYEIDGDLTTYRMLKFATAILANDPHVIIYLPVGNQELGNHSWGQCHDAVLCRPELQLRRSEWIRLRRQLNNSHRIQKYVLSYREKPLLDEWEAIEHSAKIHRVWSREKFEVKTVQDNTVFFALWRETWLRYHRGLVETMRDGAPKYPSRYARGLGWILSQSLLNELEEEIKRSG